MKGRCQRYQRGILNRIRLFSFFGPKIFSSITRLLGVVQVKRRCELYQRGTMNRKCLFSFFGPKIFLRYLDFWRSHR